MNKSVFTFGFTLDSSSDNDQKQIINYVWRYEWQVTQNEPSKKSIRHTTLYVTQDIGRHPRMKYQVFRESHVNIVIFSYCNYSSPDLYLNA